MIVLAVKLPLPSRATIALAVFAEVAVVALLLTLPAVMIVASFVSAMAALALMSASTMTPAAMLVALPTLVTSPVRFAFVVTLPAVSPAAVPVMFVPTRAVGVPSAGAIIVLLLSVSVVERPTRVSVASGNVTTRPAVETASIKVTALAALDELRKRIPLLKSVPSLIVKSPLPFGCKCTPMFALAPSARTWSGVPTPMPFLIST